MRRILKLSSLNMLKFFRSKCLSHHCSWVWVPNLETKAADLGAVMDSVHANDFPAFWDIQSEPLSLLRMLSFPDLLHNDRALLVQETQAVDIEVTRMLQDSHCSDRLALVYVNALESILARQNFSGLKERWAIHTRREEKLKLIKFFGCIIAETVKLDWLVEWKLLSLFHRRPAKLHAVFHTSDRY